MRRFLVLGGGGKTGRPVAERLRARGYDVRIGLRSAVALAGVDGVYIADQPDLAVPGSDDDVHRVLARPPRDFADFARDVAATGFWRT